MKAKAKNISEIMEQKTLSEGEESFIKSHLQFITPRANDHKYYLKRDLQ